MKLDWKTISIKDLASLICKKLNDSGIDAVLVGGACVSIYTKNKYVSYDLDFVSHTSVKDISIVLSDIGFRREGTRHFMHKDCPFYIEFVAPPLSIGSEPVRLRQKIKSRLGELVLLTPTDSVKDRLAAFYHWNDVQALEQAVLVAKAQKVSVREIKRWSDNEGHGEKYRIFLATLKK
ncbi:MAG: nucleotidyltransferase [Nitrospiraceae bacterium]|nr:MAG: nucleotidyltransferase [Nitrospiraceae bacterium]